MSARFRQSESRVYFLGLLELAIKLLPPKYKTAVIVSRPTPADIANGLSTDLMVPKQVK